MIEVLEGFPDGIVAFAAKGRLTKGDYTKVLIPTVMGALGRHKKVRLYYELGADFAAVEPGAVWEDFKVGVEHISRWERIAVVTDVEWIRFAVNIFRFLVPGDARVFATAQAAEARRWIAA